MMHDDHGDIYDNYAPGDLVIFTGYLYTPDYIYADQYDRNKIQIGVVLGTSRGVHYENVLYRIYWFKTNRISEVISAHIRLAYVRK